MMNACFLVGTVKGTPTIEKTKNGNTYCYMLVRADRPFMNADGMMEEDLFKVEVWRGIAEEVQSICKDGTVIVVKGRLRSEEVDDEYHCHIIAESVSYPDRRNLIRKTKK